MFKYTGLWQVVASFRLFRTIFWLTAVVGFLKLSITSDLVCKLLRTFEICNLFWGYLLTNQNVLLCYVAYGLCVFIMKTAWTNTKRWLSRQFSEFLNFFRMSSKPLSSKKNCCFCDVPGFLTLLGCDSNLLPLVAGNMMYEHFNKHLA